MANRIAAEILVPKKLFDKVVSSDDYDIEKLAQSYKVSKIVIARRLLDYNIITKSEYSRLSEEFKKEFLEFKSMKKNSPGGDYNNNIRFMIDKSFYSMVNNAISQNRLSFTDAFKLLGVGYKGYKALGENKR